MALQFQPHVGIKINKVISQYKLYPNVVIRKEEVYHENEPDLKVEIDQAYTVDGQQLGDLDLIKNLPFIKDITKFDKTNPSRLQCTIGFSESELKWYGWSHRAYYGFGIGSKVKVGDVAYMPTDLEDLKKWMKNFYIDGFINTSPNITTHFKTENNWLILSIANGTKTSIYQEPIPTVWGRGEWTAQTLDDAKEMATEYSRWVS